MSASAVCCDHHAGSRTYPIIHITQLIGVFGSTLTVKASMVTAPIFRVADSVNTPGVVVGVTVTRPVAANAAAPSGVNATCGRHTRQPAQP